jgi:multidrug efflux pump subunit AcrB
MALYGDLSEAEFYRTATLIKDELLSRSGVNQVDLRGIRQPEITIDVSQHTLNEFGLTLEDIAAKIQARAVDVPGGGVKTEAGEILVRTTERKDFARDFGEVEIIDASGAHSVRLESIASIREGFEDTTRQSYYNGKPSVGIFIYRVGNQTPQSVSAATHQFVEEFSQQLPQGVQLEIYSDRSSYYQERMHLLLRNGVIGLCLVLLSLGLFLEPRLAFWASMGIPISIFGSFIILLLLGGSINMVSMFAFIITLGIIVDDAVIVGENIFYHRQRSNDGFLASITGAREMAVPVFVAVLTNIIAFVPLLFVPGSTGKFFSILPAVVVSVFIISFVECLLILPAHLSYPINNNNSKSLLARVPRAFNQLLERFITSIFKPLLSGCLRNRYLTVVIALAFLGVCFTYWHSGWINFSFRPQIQTNSIDAEIELPYGVPLSEVKRIADLVEQGGLRVIENNGGQNILKGVRKELGRGGSNRAEITFTLVSQSDRSITTREFSRQWRREVGIVPGLEKLFFDFLIGPGGSSAIHVELSHPDPETLESAAVSLADYLSQYNGVTDINDGFGAGKPQLDFQVSAEAASLGITARSLGQQLRHAFYGAEAIRQQRDKAEVKVMVRLPQGERTSLAILDDLLVRSNQGVLIPIRQAASFSSNRAYTEIRRVDGRRIINVTANVVPGQVNENKILASLRNDFLPGLLAEYSGLRYSFQGRERERQNAVKQLIKGLLLLFPAIFAILAILFRSYLQAFMIMMVTPFGIIGALLGHIIMGFDLSIISIFGMIALCGVVINGGLVYTVTANSYRPDNKSYVDAALQAALRRFRPIILTALTTFFGLAPMIFEQSIQARFLVPMAISLGYGILFSTVVVLLLAPCLYTISLDIASVVSKKQIDRNSL